MGRLYVGPGENFDLPPPEIEQLNPALYRWMLAVTLRVFGAGPGGRGDLDGSNVRVDLLEIAHALLRGLDGDDHPQYLTTARHDEIAGNPHDVSAADVGNDQPVWNADRLQGRLVTNLQPLDGQFLQWFEAFQLWGPGNAPTQPGGSGIEFQSVVLEQTLPNGATEVAFPNMAPPDSLLIGLFAEVTQAITGAEAWDLGVDGSHSAWGNDIGVALGTKTTVAGFGVMAPYYVKGFPFFPVAYAMGGTGTFTGGKIELTSRYLTIPGI